MQINKNSIRLFDNTVFLRLNILFILFNFEFIFKAQIFLLFLFFYNIYFSVFNNWYRIQSKRIDFLIWIVYYTFFQWVINPSFFDITEHLYLLSFIIACFSLKTSQLKIKQKSEINFDFYITTYILLCFFFIKIIRIDSFNFLKLNFNFSNNNILCIIFYLLLVRISIASDFIFDKTQKFISNFLIVILIISIICLQSRTVVIALTIFLFGLFKKKRFFLFGTLLLFVFFNLPSKIKSNHGREFVTKITISNINGDFLFGKGINSFENLYLDFQRKHIELNPFTDSAKYADNISFAMNDYLQGIFEFGIVGILIYFVVIIKMFLVFFKNDVNKKVFLGFVGILIIAFFQYPSHVTPISVLILSTFIPVFENFSNKVSDNSSLIFNKRKSILNKIHYYLFFTQLIVIILVFISNFLSLEFNKGNSNNIVVNFYCKRSYKHLTILVVDNFLSGDFDKCQKLIENLKLFQKSDYIYRLQAKVYLNNGDTSSAINSYMHAYNTKPKNKNNYQELMKIFIAKKMISEINLLNKRNLIFNK